MTHFTGFRSLAAASAFAALTTMAIVAQTGAASASRNVLSCDGTSRQSVIECCETLVREHGAPFWMKREGKNCRKSSVICFDKGPSTAVAGGGGKYCKLVYEDSIGGKHGTGRGKR